MKVLLSLIILTTLVSCDQNTKKYYKTEYVDREVPVEVEKEVDQAFEGVFYFAEGGYMELITAEDGDVTFDTSYQSIISINPQNNTYANHPAISGKYQPQNGKIFFGKDVDYKTNAEYDLEEDTSGSDITDKHYTTFLVEETETGIKLTIKIYSGTKNNNLNYLIAERVLKSI